MPLDDFAKLFAPGRPDRRLLQHPAAALCRHVRQASGNRRRSTACRPRCRRRPGAVPARRRDPRPVLRAAAARRPPCGSTSRPPTSTPGAKQVTLDFDGTPVTYAHGPPRSTQITWPGPNRHAERAAGVRPAAGRRHRRALGHRAVGACSGCSRRAASLRRLGTLNSTSLSFKLGERYAAFEIRAGSVINPFAPGILQDFIARPFNDAGPSRPSCPSAAGRAGPVTMAVGFYGKLPARGDFVRAGLPASFIRPLGRLVAAGHRRQPAPPLPTGPRPGLRRRSGVSSDGGPLRPRPGAGSLDAERGSGQPLLPAHPRRGWRGRGARRGSWTPPSTPACSRCGRTLRRTCSPHACQAAFEPGRRRRCQRRVGGHRAARVCQPARSLRCRCRGAPPSRR